MSEEVKQSNYGVTGTLSSAEQGSACRLSFTVSLTCIALEKKTGHFISVPLTLLIEADWDAAKWGAILALRLWRHVAGTQRET